MHKSRLTNGPLRQRSPRPGMRHHARNILDSKQRDEACLETKPDAAGDGMRGGDRLKNSDKRRDNDECRRREVHDERGGRARRLLEEHVQLALPARGDVERSYLGGDGRREAALMVRGGHPACAVARERRADARERNGGGHERKEVAGPQRRAQGISRDKCLSSNICKGYHVQQAQRDDLKLFILLFASSMHRMPLHAFFLELKSTPDAILYSKDPKDTVSGLPDEFD